MANVGLVIVSHSARLAEGVCDLARQMTRGAVACVAAGGLKDDSSALGTDATLIAAAIQTADGGAGVLVFADLGSAVLSADLSFELLDPTQRSRVRLAEAPFVEGALAAAVRAAAGGSLDEVDRDSRDAARRTSPSPVAESPAPGTDSPAVQERELRRVLPNPLGLHARPAARLMTTAAAYGVTLHARNCSKDGAWVDGRSLTQLATLGVRRGEELGLRVRGERAVEAARALALLVESGFGEVERQAPAATDRHPLPPAPHGALAGIAVAPGWAVGPAVPFAGAEPVVTVVHGQDAAEQLSRLAQARQASERELAQLRERAIGRGRTEEADVLAAQALLLDDPELLDQVESLVRDQRINVEAAWQQAFSRAADRFRRLPDTYAQGRAADVLDVGRRLLRWLSGGTAPQPPLMPGILLARDLLPSDLAAIDPEVTLGICLAGGSPLSHAVILARAMGIPAAVGLGPELVEVPAGTQVALDGDRGWLWIDPPPGEIARRRSSPGRAHSADLADAATPAVTRDGRTVEVVANIGSLAEARAAIRFGAEGVGVLRTEFLYLDRLSPPSEDEQLATYSAILEALQGRTVVARTLDIGGDKSVPYLPLPAEDNPFLGQRGLRLSLLRPEIFLTQLRALLRASAAGPLRLLLPMVTTVEELSAANQLLQAAREELLGAGIPVADSVPLGIMVETPSAALLADHFARQVDFFSIGTNDLAQYTMAAERTHPGLVALGDAASPAILRLIRTVVEAAHAAGIRASVCGEMAADPDLTAILLGLGVDELSMGAAAIPRTKALIRGGSFAAARDLAEHALALESAREVRRLATAWDPR